MIVTEAGTPLEIFLAPTCGSDMTCLKEELSLPLPSGAVQFVDKGDTDYKFENKLRAERKITLLPARKPNLKRQHSPEVKARLQYARKRIETTFSQVTAHMAKHLQAVTARGFEIKIWASFVAYAILK